MKAVSAYIVGLIFALGLGIGGMTNPNKVIGFLDITGNWDPSLIFVMMGAIAVGLLSYRWIVTRPGPVLGTGFNLPTKKEIEPNLIIGGLIFGAGWGLAGFCPGPAIVSAAFLKPAVYGFVIAMLVGSYLYTLVHLKSRKG